MSNRAKMIAIRQAEKELDEYCLEVLEEQESETAITMNSFVGEVQKHTIMHEILALE